jgi:hypothetical protein
MVSPPTTDNGLSTGAMAGIGAGSGVAALAILAVIGVVLLRRRRHLSRNEPKQEAPVVPAVVPPPEKPVVEGPAELVAQEVKPTYELSDTPRKFPGAGLQQPYTNPTVPAPVLYQGYNGPPPQQAAPHEYHQQFVSYPPQTQPVAYPPQAQAQAQDPAMHQQPWYHHQQYVAGTQYPQEFQG